MRQLLRRTFLLVLFVLSAAHGGVFAQNREKLQQLVKSMEQNGPLAKAAWGVLAVDRDGQILVQHNKGQRLVPASNLKLVTTGAALHAFGPGHRFYTELAYSGSITDGVLDGDVYIVGHGDPTLGARDSIALKADALFWKWKTLLREAGIRKINGRIIGDGTLYEGNLEHQSWSYDDVGTYYGTGTDALCFYENAIDLEVSAGGEGTPVRVRQSYPNTPWMHFSNHSFTGRPGSGNSLYLYTTDLAPFAELRGSFAVDRPAKTEHFANKFGALTCAYYFWKNLRETGWEVSGGYAYVNREGDVCGPGFTPEGKAVKPLSVIGRTESPALKDIARITNVRSDNFYAEAMLRAMGEASSQIASYDSCLVALNEVLSGLGTSPEGILQADGSGLSRHNSLSPEWMVSYLTAMQKSPAFPDFLASLPHPGEGTLTSLLPQWEARGRVCLKSGSMEGVLCYSGYILDEEGQPQAVFSFLTNHTTAPTKEVRAALARLLMLLVQ